MSNRPGRPRGGPGLAERAARYKLLRDEGATYAQAAEAMGVSPQAIRWYAKHLRDVGQLPPVPVAVPKPPPEPRPPSKCRLAVLEHFRRWPDSWFSEWDLRRLGINAGSVLDKLAAEGVVEVVDGMRYPSDQKVPARRYRLAPAGTVQNDSEQLDPVPYVSGQHRTEADGD